MAVLVAALPLGCSAGGGRSDSSGETTGVAVLAVTAAPSDATCLQVTVTGSRTVQNSFSLTPGQNAVFTLKGLPIGNVVFTELAFDTACSAVTSASTPTWLSDPVTTTLVPGVVASVTVVLRRNGQAIVTSDFEDDSGAPDAAVGTPDAGPESGVGAACTFFYDDTTLPLLTGGGLPPLP
jgi:hypothetical protein